MSKQERKEWYVKVPLGSNGYCNVMEKQSKKSVFKNDPDWDHEICTCYSSDSIKIAREISSLPELQEALQNIVTSIHSMDGHEIIEERYVATLDAAHTALRHSRGRK